MKKLVLVLSLVLAGCGTMRDQATLIKYSIQRKILLTALTPCTQTNKPALVTEWVKEKNIDKMWVVCDTDCNCKLVKRPTK